MRILIATWDSAGGVQPECTLMRGLVANGHDVHAASPRSLQSRIETVGATFERLPNIVEYDARTPIAPDLERPFIFKEVILSQAFAQDVYDASRRLGPDVQLVELALMSSVIAARAAGAPVAFLTTTVFKLFATLGDLYAQSRPLLQPLATHLGYQLPATLVELIGNAPVIASTYRPFEPPANFPPGYFPVGPLRDKVVAGDTPFTRRSPDKPLILVSLSTGFMDQAAILKTLCQAIAKLDVEAIVTTGHAVDPQSLEAGPNTRVVRWMPHDTVLPITRLVVTHAGHGTVMGALSYGIPTLLLPMGRDQPLVAARAAELGLGAVIDCHATAAEFASAIERELADTAKPIRCREFLRQLDGHPGLTEAVSLVERLART